MKSLFFLFLLGLTIASCNKAEIESTVTDNSKKSTRTSELGRNLEDNLNSHQLNFELLNPNTAFIISNLELHKLLLETNPNMELTFYTDELGNTLANYNPNGNGNPNGVAPELVCKGASIEAIADCMREYTEDGVCLTVGNCYTCAWEGDCPSSKP